MVFSTTVLNRVSQCTIKYDLRLFRDFSFTSDFKQQIISNILMFVPIGYFISREYAHPVIISFLFSAVIELTQLIFRRGYFELNDILGNLTGAFIGSLLFFICAMIKKNR